MLTSHRFLLAQLHFDSLKGKRSPKAIRTALKELSTGSDAYDDAYNDAERPEPLSIENYVRVVALPLDLQSLLF